MASIVLQRKVLAAFRSAKSKSLTDTFTFSLSDDVNLDDDFNFATGEFDEPSAVTTEVDGVVLSAARSSDDTQRLTVLFERSDVGDISVYDSATWNDHTYTIESYEDNQYTVQAVFTRSSADV